MARTDSYEDQGFKPPRVRRGNSLEQAKAERDDPFKSGDPEALGSIVTERYKKGVDGVRTQLNDYWLNHSFLLGDQWVWWNNRARRLEELPRDPERVQATINRLWPSSRSIVAKVMQRELTFEVTPTGADDATMQSARLGESILEAKRHDSNWELLREKATWMAWKGGTAALAVDWDPDAENPVLLESGERIAGGDTVETPLSIAEFVVEPGVRDPERARWWIKAQVLPPAVAKGTFKLDKEPAADATAGLTPFQQKLLTSATNSSDERADLTMVLTYYERPNPEHPEGYVCVVVEGRVVEGPHKWPFPFKDHLNFVVMRETPDETHWAGRTVVTQARPVQVALNASWSAIIEHMKLAGNARLAVPLSSMDLIDQFTDLPAEQVPYPDGSTPPGWIAPPAMPGWWVQQPEKLAAEMDDILGFHDVSRGTAPVNIESGYGLSVLAEQDATPTMRLAKEAAFAFGRMASMVLKLYESQVDNTRSAVVQSPGLPPDTVQWSGKDLAGQTTATVPLDAILPRSRAAMMAAAEKLVQMQLITSVEQFTKVAELPGSAKLIAALSPDVERARRENHAMAQGRPRIPERWDEHKAHITEHNVFRKSAHYDGLSEEVKQIIEEHVQAHENFGAEEMGRQMAKVAVDPALAAAPDAGGAPTLDPSQLPPEAIAASVRGQGMPPTEGGAPPPPPEGAAPGMPPGMLPETQPPQEAPPT